MQFFFMANKFESPFVFGVRVEGDTFTDRRIETDRLKANFTYGVNTILISPRRMGKTSLVDRVCSLVGSDDIWYTFGSRLHKCVCHSCCTCYFLQMGGMDGERQGVS